MADGDEITAADVVGSTDLQVGELLGGYRAKLAAANDALVVRDATVMAQHREIVELKTQIVFLSAQVSELQTVRDAVAIDVASRENGGARARAPRGSRAK